MKLTILRYLTLIISLTGAVLAFGDKIEVISFIHPKLAAAWPFVFALATIADRIGKIMIDFLDDNQMNDSYTGPKDPPVKRVYIPAIIAFSALCLFTGCARDADGHSRYTGPAITFGASYQGVSGTIHLDPSFVHQKK